MPDQAPRFIEVCLKSVQRRVYVLLTSDGGRIITPYRRQIKYTCRFRIDFQVD
ncbi:hypothetical protein EDD52_12145 [Primorskyibacter sedentarius]|uniref:Uncharacterized protein n=1 Tax=Primorskyibacter sedentarius TaxID=745311 RepID=A0A4R3J1F0_9RHOB|nr:hypothetical protein EDD52_12145 [Primorskyibacter sedentarius]